MPDTPNLRLHKVEFIATVDVLNDEGKVTGTQPVMESRDNGPGQPPTQSPIVLFEADIPEAFYEWLRARGVKV